MARMTPTLPLLALLLALSLLLPAATAANAAPQTNPHRRRRALLQSFFGGGANGADTNGMFEQFGGGERNSAFAEGYPGVQSDTLSQAATPAGWPLGLSAAGSARAFEWPTRVVGGGLVAPAATVPSGSVACGTVGLAFQDVPC